jgi:hypothetical protein
MSVEPSSFRVMIVESIHPPCLNLFCRRSAGTEFDRRSGNAGQLPIAHPFTGLSRDRRDYTRHFFISSPSYDQFAQY